jgi:hypothetical protein
LTFFFGAKTPDWNFSVQGWHDLIDKHGSIFLVLSSAQRSKNAVIQDSGKETVFLAHNSPSSNRGRSPKVASPKVIPEVIHVSSDKHQRLEFQCLLCNSGSRICVHKFFKDRCKLRINAPEEVVKQGADDEQIRQSVQRGLPQTGD